MKISKLFHWLYASVMMLPLVVAPIFAVYCHRHQINDYSIQVQEKEVVDFNQLFSADLSNSTIDNLTLTNNGYGYYSVDGFTSQYSIRFQSNYPAIYDHIYIFDPQSEDSNIGLEINGWTGSRCFTRRRFKNTYYENNFTIICLPNLTYDNALLRPQVFDLTQMYGEGNEPSLEEFNLLYTRDYYDFTLSHEELVNGELVTYNDTDIGSQFIYDMYNCVDKYFNYDRVFNFGDLYTWLNTTFFSGQVPLGFFIFWHLLIYWLLTSLLWLLFDVLMYVPQLIHRWLDKASLS